MDATFSRAQSTTSCSSVGVIVFSEVGHIYLPGLKFKERISRLTFMDEAMSYQELADHLVAILGSKEVK